MSSTSKPASREAKDTRIRKRGGVTRPTKAPLGGMSFKLFIYILGAISLAYSIYFAYRMSELQRIKSENLEDRLRGKRPTQSQAPTTKSTRDTIQDKIEDLAAMLGIQPVDLARAIAGVVNVQIPKESSASIASEAKSNDPVLSAFTEGLNNPQEVPVTPTLTEASATSSTGGMAASIVSAVKHAGFDDMGMDAD